MERVIDKLSIENQKEAFYYSPVLKAEKIMMTEHLVMPIINNKMKSKRKLTWLEIDKKLKK